MIEVAKEHLTEILVIVKASIIASVVCFLDSIVNFLLSITLGVTFVNPVVKQFCDDTAPIIKYLTLLLILFLTAVRLWKERKKKKQDNRPFGK